MADMYYNTQIIKTLSSKISEYKDFQGVIRLLFIPKNATTYIVAQANSYFL